MSALVLRIERHLLLWRGFTRGAAIPVLVALAASFVASHYGGPALIYALFFGIALNFLYETAVVRPGIDVCATTVLRWGVALLGARITLSQITSLGAPAATLVVLAVVLTIALSLALSRSLRLTSAEGVLIGGSVAICGASAAIALYAVLPHRRMREHFLVFAIVGVTAISTLAMLVYPMVAVALQLSPHDTGVFLGGTIHDVAQVVGAGYMLSPAIGDAATVVKLLRVALLAPAVLLVGLLFRAERAQDRAGNAEAGPPVPVLPWFIILFGIIVALNSAGLVPANITTVMTEASRACVLIAIAALGVKTAPGRLSQLGWRPAALIAACTAVMFVVVLAGQRFWLSH